MQSIPIDGEISFNLPLSNKQVDGIVFFGSPCPTERMLYQQRRLQNMTGTPMKGTRLFGNIWQRHFQKNYRKLKDSILRLQSIWRKYRDEVKSQRDDAARRLMRWWKRRKAISQNTRNDDVPMQDVQCEDQSLDESNSGSWQDVTSDEDEPLETETLLEAKRKALQQLQERRLSLMAQLTTKMNLVQLNDEQLDRMTLENTQQNGKYETVTLQFKFVKTKAPKVQNIRPISADVGWRAWRKAQHDWGAPEATCRVQWANDPIQVLDEEKTQKPNIPITCSSKSCLRPSSSYPLNEGTVQEIQVTRRLFSTAMRVPRKLMSSKKQQRNSVTMPNVSVIGKKAPIGGRNADRPMASV